ncbi:MAG: hypothetical protein COA94_05160 [Rickettsiales bacterium]|nr:MAG: hypothetical protein COA94_05160 [Rickettsiales bacterium]
MAFDLSTAKPVKRRFDLSTASPVVGAIDLEAFDPAGESVPSGEARPEFIGSGVLEPIAAIGSGALASVAGGLAGLGAELTPGAEPGVGGDVVRQFQEAAFQPKTRAGQEGLENVGNVIQSMVDRFNVPASGIGALLELVSGQGLDQAVQTIEGIQAQGVGPTVAERTFQQTGSPLAAATAGTIPDLVGAILGTKGAGQALKTPQAQAIGREIQAVPETAKQVVEGVAGLQRPATRELAREIQAGTADPAAARVELKPLRTFEGEPTGIERFFDTRGPKIQKDSLAAQAVKQGFDEGVIQPLKQASRTDKKVMSRMAEVAERISKDKLFGMKNRPGDLAGDVLMNKVRAVRDANKRAGKAIGIEARKLRGEKVNVANAGDKFLEDLDGIGIKLGDDGKLDFTGSIIEFQGGPKSTIRNIFKRIGDIENPTAHDVHELKLLIDSEVTYGKGLKGLAGKAERILKDYRNNLDVILDESFTDYNNANVAYSETIKALDALQDVAGKKMNLLGKNADKSTGTLMRRLMSNAQSRIRLLDAIEDIEEAVKKHGGSDLLRIEGKAGKADNLQMLVLFADELDNVFGPAARTSLQGQFDQALQQGVRAGTTKAGALDLGVSIVGKGIEKLRRINKPRAFKAIKELLKEP